MNDKIIRNEIRFIGYVQGVGFRYRAKYAARACGVTGWVRNEWDGSVLMEVQGSEAQINEMLKMINAGRFIEIDRQEKRIIPTVEYEHGFHIH